MSVILTYVVPLVVILGFMILIHEFGHYAVAKLLGVRVEVFSIGFGKRLIGFRRGETDYRIAAIPLGGYVKMSGENPMDERTGDPREFMSHPRWHRFLIAIAGPAMNILLAVGLLAGVYMFHFEYPVFLDQPVVISWVKKDSAAAKAGIQPGDRITRLDGMDNPTWEQIEPVIMLNPRQPLEVSVQRGDKTFKTTLTPVAVTASQVGSAGWFPKETVVVGDVEPGKPAALAGIQEDDKILELNSQPLPSIDAMIESLQVSKTQPIKLTILRQGKTFPVEVTPVLASTEEPGEMRYRIGFQAQHETKIGHLGFVAAIQRSVDDNKKTSLLILELVQKLVQRKVSLRTIEGPIGIGRAAGEAASAKGWTPLLGLTAAISLNLGIFNLLPIPILDGGVILLLAVEGLMRRDISLRIKERIYQAAFVFLVLFAAMVIYNDLAKTIPSVMQRLP